MGSTNRAELLGSFGLLGLIVAFAAVRAGGVESNDRHIYLLGLGVLALLHAWFGRPSSEAARCSRLLLTLSMLPLCYVAFQILPLPVSWLRVLSPARAELALALEPVGASVGMAPLSVFPSATVTQFFLLAGYAVILLVVCERTTPSRAQFWLPVFPIVVIAAIEAGLGLAQAASGGPQAFASGTYPNRNHFAGLLEMAFPFAAIYPLAVLQRRNRASRWRAIGGVAVAALLFSGILFSFSRMGFVSLLGSLLLTAALAIGGGASGRRRFLVVALLAVMLVSSVLLAPDRLVRRFGELTLTEGAFETRFPVWRDTWQVIHSYPLFGCGLGGYAAAFHKYKGAVPAATVDYAHNDYLQALAELGLIGFLAVASLIALILVRTLRAAMNNTDSDSRYMAAACSGAIAAILIHSLADFNLYIPANAMVFAWILGVSAACPQWSRAQSAAVTVR